MFILFLQYKTSSYLILKLGNYILFFFWVLLYFGIEWENFVLRTFSVTSGFELN